MGDVPAWLQHLDEEDYQFIKRLVTASGSLKELADQYGVSYPTNRLRLDRLIGRIRALDEHAPTDAFQARIRLLVAVVRCPRSSRKSYCSSTRTVAKESAND